MLWWEREIYIKLLADYQEQKKQEQMMQQYKINSGIEI